MIIFNPSGNFLGYFSLKIYLCGLLKPESFNVFGTEWGLSIVGRWLAIMSDAKREADF